MTSPNRRAWAAWIWGLLACGPAPLTAQSAPSTDIEPPAFQDRRFDEDWSVLRDAGGSRITPWEKIKFIPLGKDGDVWMTLGGQVRERYEHYDEFQFGASQPSSSGGFLLSRLRLSADLHVSRYFRVFAEAKSSLETHTDLSGGDGPGFVDTLNLQNLFADVVIPLGGPATLTVRGGRQELLFGAQRLVGPSDWTNVRRTFQGVSGIVDTGVWRITPMWAELVTVDPRRPDQVASGHKLYGVYASGAATKTVTSELYWLGADNLSAAFNGTSGHERRQTIGGRLWRGAASSHTDFDLEAAGQFGTIGGQDIRAWMISANAGHTFGARLAPRPFVTMDFASGDDAPGGRVGTFNQLYPTNHTYLGAVDYVGRQNILSPSGGVDLRPVPRLSIQLTQFLFWRASGRDALYGNGGSVMLPGTAVDARYVGAELDLLATYHFDRHILAYASYNHFFSGAFVRQSGPGHDSRYVYAALQFTF